VLQEAVAVGALSSGAFDVTIAPLMNLWDFTHAAIPPTQAAINEVRSRVDYRQIRLDVKNRRAGLGEQGMMLDLGGLAKGYAADRAKQVLIEWGIESAYINLGGNVLLLGSKPDGSAWKVGIRHPRIQNSLWLEPSRPRTSRLSPVVTMNGSLSIRKESGSTTFSIRGPAVRPGLA